MEQLGIDRSHPTADELYAKLRDLLPCISLGTVYRNLELMSREGIVRKISGDKSRFDADTRRHCHMRCMGCGRLVDIDDAVIDGVFDELDLLRVRGGFEGYSLEFTGRCGHCGFREVKANKEKKGGVRC
ncbi:MAG: transcriptional repressor [Victivallales bacterium]|nr:transcriptional repressor [Victivallales bacterium]